MAGQKQGVLQWLRTLARIGADAQTPDDELLQRFVAASDQAAFSILLQKHGPIVWGVCRRVLMDFADAEDAFQATFLVFAQKAASIRKRTSVGCWLYGVANRIARKLRDKNQRERRRPFATTVNVAAADSDVARRELGAALDDALAELPERFRLPLVLCYLHGKTQDQAAAELGWNKSTLRGRLERGRALMQERLAHRGITLSATLLASALAHQANASISAALTSLVGSAVLRVVSGQALAGHVSAQTLALTIGEINAMLLHKWIHALTIASAAVLLMGGFGVLYGIANRDATAPNPKERPIAAEQKDDELIVGEKLSAFVQGTVGKYMDVPKDLQGKESMYAFRVDNAVGKDIPKGIRVNVVATDEADKYQIVAKARKKIDREATTLDFRALFVIENNQVVKVKKEGHTWWVEPKSILILERGHTQDWIKTLGAFPQKTQGNEDELRKLLIERQHSTIRELELLQARGIFDLNPVVAPIEPAKRYLESTLEMTDKTSERIAICRRFVEFSQNLEWGVDVRVRSGKIDRVGMEPFIQNRIDAEILLLKEIRRGK